jgi:alkylmercury lyase
MMVTDHESGEVESMNPEQTTLRQQAESVRAWAFRLLLEGRQPVAARLIAEMSGLSKHQVETALRLLEIEGRLRRDPAGQITGSAGLSLEPTRHRIQIDGADWWAWCAFDALGILAALGNGGTIKSVCAQSGAPLQLEFAGSTPASSSIVIVIADEEAGGSLIDDWCPKNNFFRSEHVARQWVESCGVAGQVLALEEGAERAAERWHRCLELTRGKHVESTR